MQFAFGYAAPLIMEAAIAHGYFDALDRKPLTAEEVAAETHTSVRGARAILNALGGLELLVKHTDGRFTLGADAAAFLVTGKPGYFGGMIKHTSKQLIPRWLHLSETVKAGTLESGVNQETEGTEFFHQFVEDIFPMSYPAARNLSDALGVASASSTVKVLDLAAGSGVWGIALAERSAHVHVTAVDWPGMLDITQKVAARFGVAERFTFSPGDLTNADFGTGHNIATLGHILHSEGETRSRALLHKTIHALAPGGTIAIAEFLVNEDRSGPPMGLIFGVNMLAATQEGNTYSFGEISGWLKEAGFENARTLESPGPSPLILANRPA
jgi:ubiquinone/menaquinone biosynthesis C-methylase UbiE